MSSLVPMSQGRDGVYRTTGSSLTKVQKREVEAIEHAANVQSYQTYLAARHQEELARARTTYVENRMDDIEQVLMKVAAQPNDGVRAGMAEYANTYLQTEKRILRDTWS